jgi:hypothetical protein
MCGHFMGVSLLGHEDKASLDGPVTASFPGSSSQFNAAAGRHRRWRCQNMNRIAPAPVI